MSISPCRRRHFRGTQRIGASSFASAEPSRVSWLLADVIQRRQRGAFHLRLYPALHGDKLGKTADRRSVFRQLAPCVRHIDQHGSVRSVGGAPRQSKAFGGVLSIIVVGTQDCPLRSLRYPVPRKCGENTSSSLPPGGHPPASRVQPVSSPSRPATPCPRGCPTMRSDADVCRTPAWVMKDCAGVPSRLRWFTAASARRRLAPARYARCIATDA